MVENQNISVEDLIEQTEDGKPRYKFYIPHYQRGYRWTKTNARQLLKDLKDFDPQKDEQYCLQPIVLKKYNDGFCVVDGQQRLTTLGIILIKLESPCFEIIYECEGNKTLHELLKNDSSSETINDHFRTEVNNEVAHFFKENTIDKGEFKEKFKKVFFIHYQVNDEDDHEAFLRLNSGKTPLTSSELIRALYMVKSSGISEQNRTEISKEWELIENTLRNDLFWQMFNAKGLENTPTRIDLLFALVLDIPLEETKANPRLVFDQLDAGKDDKEYDLEKVWNEVLRCFWWMQSCYKDIELCNYLGWICNCSEIGASSIYKKWLVSSEIDDFKNSVIKEIILKFKDILLEDVNYDWDKSSLRNLFLLLNILDCNNIQERFRFDLYNSEQQGYDIEHIDSRTMISFEGDDASVQENKKEYLKSVYAELSKSQKDEFKSILPPFEDSIDLCDFVKMRDKLVEVINTEPVGNEKENYLGNLCLLNATINRSYHNDIFPLKRKKIIEWLNDGSHYIPPCTRRVFMKFYTQTASNIIAWQQTDYDDYFNTMKELYGNFLNKEINKNTASKEEIDLYRTPIENSGTDRNCSVEDSQHDSMRDSEERMNSETDFESFMNKYNIVIPKIQRCYVQGREDKNGDKCIEEFAQKLVDCVTNSSEKDFLLDFVYGIDCRNEKGKMEFHPLDGQQRLTTLLLLAWICGKTKETWSFKYDSRRATEMFIDGLLQHPYQKNKSESDKTCSDLIRRERWFLSIWEEDPCIAGMLRMLNSLNEKLQKKNPCEFHLEKIKFDINYLDVKSSSYDHIFLKMNSRGKELSDWDNLKAVLDEYEHKPEDWQGDIQDWYEKMWKEFSEPTIEKVDDKMESIVYLALSCVNYNDPSHSTFKLSNWLFGKDLENDEMFDNRKKTIDKLYLTIKRFFSTLNKQSQSTELFPNWAQNYTLDFQSNSAESFYRPLMAMYVQQIAQSKEWMRFCCNMIENTINGFDDFVRLFKRFDEMENSKIEINDKNFYVSLITESQFTNPSDQLKEEIEKARQIVSKREKPNSVGPVEDVIIQAENYAFFKGAIRFLFRDENGDWNWKNFDVKWNNVKGYIDEKGEAIMPRYHIPFLSALLRSITQWSQLEQKRIFVNDSSTIKNNLLLAKDYVSEIHKILLAKKLNDIQSEEFVDGENEIVCEIKNFISQEKDLRDLMKLFKNKDLRFSHWCVLYPYGGRDAEVHFARYTNIKKVKNIKNVSINKEGINFEYNNNYFQWHTNNYIYSMKDTGEKSWNEKDLDAKEQEDRYYCFKVENVDDIKKHIESLITEAAASSTTNPE